MMGSLPPPTFWNSHNQGSGFHGSPVEAKKRSDDRSCLRNVLLAVRHQRADQGGRDAQRGDVVSLDQRPQPVGRRVIRRAVVQEQRRAQQQSAEDQPRSHHPAHVGHPVEQLAGVQVGAEGHVLRGFDREAAVGVHRAFGSAGRAGGVDHHQGILGGGPFGVGAFWLAGDKLVPPVFAAGWMKQVYRQVPR